MLTALLALLVLVPATRPSPAADEGGIAAYFSPDGHAADAVIYEVDRATKTLDVAAYSVPHAGIAKAIRDAHARGVVVRVVMDKAQASVRYSSATYLANGGVDVRIDNVGGLMHHKFAVIDGAVLLTGSFNWTKGGDENNAENLLVIRDHPDLAEAYAREFERVLGRSEPYERK